MTSRLVILVLALAGLSAGAVAQEPERPIAVVSSGIAGRLGDPDCAAAELGEDGVWSSVAAAIDGAPAHVVVLDSSGLLTTSGVMRWAAVHEPGAVADAVVAAGWQALGFGLAELGTARAEILPLLRELRTRRIPVIATNLRCRDSNDSLCAMLVDGHDGVSIRRLADGRRVAVIAILPHDALDRVPHELGRRVIVDRPDRVLERAVRQARRRGADQVLVTIDHGPEPDALDAVIELARGLPDDARPTAIIASSAGERIVMVRPAGRGADVVAIPSGSVRIVVETPDGLALRAPTAAAEPPAAITALRAALARGYCADLGGRFAGGRLVRPIDRRGVLELAARALREAGRADVAIVSGDILDPRWTPPNGALGPSDLQMAIVRDEVAVRASVEASWLEKATKRLRGAQLVQVGLERDPEDDTRVRVAGRRTEKRARYRVVTTRSVARDLPDDAEWTELEGVSTRRALIAHLRVARAGDPRDALPDPADQVVWLGVVRGEARFAGTSISNPAGYQASQLNRSDSVTFGFEANGRGVVDSRNWEWANEAITRYRTTRTVGEDSEFLEGDDVVSGRSTVTWRGLRDEGSPSSRWTVPSPFAEGYLETELTVPGERDFRHVLFRATMGLAWPVRPELAIRVFGGAEVALLDPEGEWRPGVGARLIIQPWTIFEAGYRKIQIESDVDYFVAGPFADDVQTLRGSVDAAFDLGAAFAVVIGMDTFLQRVGDDDVGIGIDATAGLRLHWTERGVVR